MPQLDFFMFLTIIFTILVYSGIFWTLFRYFFSLINYFTQIILVLLFLLIMLHYVLLFYDYCINFFTFTCNLTDYFTDVLWFQFQFFNILKIMLNYVLLFYDYCINFFIFTCNLTDYFTDVWFQFQFFNSSLSLIALPNVKIQFLFNQIALFLSLFMLIFSLYKLLLTSFFFFSFDILLIEIFTILYYYLTVYFYSRYSYLSNNLISFLLFIFFIFFLVIFCGFEPACICEQCCCFILYYGKFYHSFCLYNNGVFNQPGFDFPDYGENFSCFTCICSCCSKNMLFFIFMFKNQYSQKILFCFKNLWLIILKSIRNIFQYLFQNLLMLVELYTLIQYHINLYLIACYFKKDIHPVYLVMWLCVVGFQITSHFYPEWYGFEDPLPLPPPPPPPPPPLTVYCFCPSFDQMCLCSYEETCNCSKKMVIFFIFIRNYIQNLKILKNKILSFNIWYNNKICLRNSILQIFFIGPFSGLVLWSPVFCFFTFSILTGSWIYWLSNAGHPGPILDFNIEVISKNSPVSFTLSTGFYDSNMNSLFDHTGKVREWYNRYVGPLTYFNGMYVDFKFSQSAERVILFPELTTLYLYFPDLNNFILQIALPKAPYKIDIFPDLSVIRCYYPVVKKIILPEIYDEQFLWGFLILSGNIFKNLWLVILKSIRNIFQYLFQNLLMLVELYTLIQYHINLYLIERILINAFGFGPLGTYIVVQLILICLTPAISNLLDHQSIFSLPPEPSTLPGQLQQDVYFFENQVLCCSPSVCERGFCPDCICVQCNLFCSDCICDGSFVVGELMDISDYDFEEVVIITGPKQAFMLFFIFMFKNQYSQKILFCFKNLWLIILKKY